MNATAERESLRMLKSDAQDHGNYSITTSVTIRVTPKEDYLVSWGVLWAAFFFATLAAAYQVFKEHQVIESRKHGDDTGTTTVDGEAVSTADITRSMFRRLLLVAMLARLILMPVQIWSDPMWWQFVSDTLPEMIFASAWTLLVSFFVQLVGIAMGTGTNTSPGIVIQATSYVVYLLLIGLQLYNDVATVLLYALLCCIYAALFGTVIYFCPRLLSLLQPSLTRHGGLAMRLTVCTVVCVLVFAAHTVGYARLVVAPPRRVYWWWNYGVLELFPSTIFLVIMSPSSNKSDREPLPDDPSRRATIRRTESASSASGTRKQQETISLLKNTGGYGSTTDTTINLQV